MVEGDDRAAAEGKRLSEELESDLEESYGERQRQQRGAEPRDEAAQDLAFEGMASRSAARAHWDEVRSRLAAGRLPSTDELRSVELLRALGVDPLEAVPDRRDALERSDRARRFVRLLEAAAEGREEMGGQPLGEAVSALASEVEAAVREGSARREKVSGDRTPVGAQELAAVLRDLEVVLSSTPAAERRP